MREKKVKKNYIIRLEKGEQIIESLTRFQETNNIKGAFFFGIGAASKAEISHFNLETKKYSSKTFEKDMEIINLAGNLGWLEDKPVIHCHITLSDPEMNTFGGHLKEATVGATCEIVLKILNKKLERRLNKETNLNLLDL